MRLVFTALLFGILPPSHQLKLIEEFDHTVQLRLQEPLPNTLGMSRVMVRPSFGQHFRPMLSDLRDYAPVTEQEHDLLARMEQENLQLGFYIFGAAILDQPADAMDFRTLKGPGAITQGTPRAGWYPLIAGAGALAPVAAASSGQSLPNWKEIYPLARRAMQSFADGGRGFETELSGWTVAARPTVAKDGRCVVCHNSARIQTSREFAVGDALGGVLYAYRQAPASN